ncbi:hypothetical protein EVAR_85924_1 [Eumeta japonica]|uniref:Reverse transcriptase domain-containing protein n=1 Tax=Eumeta variegata TaxID=151549 RepID=A0A4C2A576_EUMVA|nr:hypothetical protein EVAR_85924_1 [Eumeta japonica]
MEVFLAIANKCLELAYFPALEDRTCRHNTETWKEDYTLPKSYRPIVLSNTGSCHSEARKMPSTTSLIMSKGDRKQKAVLLISLDIEGAFDNAWWPALKHSSSTKMPG